MTTRVRPLGDFIACLTGPAIWAAHFFIVYGAETAVCVTASAPTAAMRWTVIVTTALAVSAIAIAMTWQPRKGDGAAGGFLRMVALSLAALSTAAILATALSAFRLSACVSPAG